MLGDDGGEPRYAVARVLGARGAADGDVSGRHPFHRTRAKSIWMPGKKTPGVVAALTPDASCHRASPKVTGHIREIVREQVTSLETTEAGKNHQVFGKSRWPVLE